MISFDESKHIIARNGVQGHVQYEAVRGMVGALGFNSKFRLENTAQIITQFIYNAEGKHKLLHCIIYSQQICSVYCKHEARRTHRVNDFAEELPHE